MAQGVSSGRSYGTAGKGGGGGGGGRGGGGDSSGDVSEVARDNDGSPAWVATLRDLTGSGPVSSERLDVAKFVFILLVCSGHFLEPFYKMGNKPTTAGLSLTPGYQRIGLSLPPGSSRVSSQTTLLVLAVIVINWGVLRLPKKQINKCDVRE
jgi:hypothetical protein